MSTPPRRTAAAGRKPAPTGTRGARIDQAYETLRERIVTGRLAPGTRIIETEIADRLGISRTPVRSALHKLQQEGYIVAADGGRNARLIVAPLTRQDAVELYSIVAELEALAARWAAELEDAPRARLAHTLTELNETLLELGGAAELDTAVIFDVHTAFHWRIVEAVGAPRLQALHRSIKPQAERYRRIYSTASPENIRASYDEHRVIIDAISAGDGGGAEQAIRANWRNSLERVSRLIRALGERGQW